MKLVCKKQNLNAAVASVSRAVALKSTIAALEGIKIKVSETTAELTGYDLEMGIKTEIPVESDKSGEFVFNSQLFSDIIRKMPDGDITIEIDERLSTRISSGMIEYSIISLSADEYPDIPDFESEKSIKISQNILKNMINQTVFAVSVNENKPILTGELFEITDKSFNLVALDGFRLAVRSEQIDCDEDYKFVVPSKALKELSNLLKDDDDLFVTIYTSRKHIVFDVNGYRVMSRLLEGDFHNYRGSLPPSSSTEVIINTKSLINSLERCTLLINDRIKAPVKCLFENGEVKISCSTALGKVNDALEADISGSVIEIGFNCRYLIEALKATESDKVRLFMNGGLGPMKISPLEGDSYTFLVLPVRLTAN
ncbi:MAG TPA: DNA polymerase III subunit beta [Oscillospiraceae bacterium]|nr:DNA polymerase III subunit beta [Oscillospiraceae bacterium]